MGTSDLIIVGGESGPGSRPCDIANIRSIVEQCQAAGVKCFVKQLGSKPFEVQMGGFSPGVDAEEFDSPLQLKDRKGGDMEEWPADLRVREFPK